MKVTASVDVRGPAFEAQALWLDPQRWPNFVEGFGTVQKVEGDWPRAGRIVWMSGPHGRGRVAEEMDRYEAGVEHLVFVEEEKLFATQTVTFTPRDDGTVRVTVVFRYTLRTDNAFMRIANLLFVRRSQRDALRRTLRRYANERDGDLSFEA